METTDVHVTKHMTIMRIAAEQPFRDMVVFDNSDPDDDEDREPEQFMTDHQMWGELGEPDVITVTIEPGDLLNGDD